MIDFNTYFILPSLFGNLQKDVEILFETNENKECLRHSIQVVKLAVTIARRWNLDPETLTRAALLHDIGNVMAPDQMLKLAEELEWQLDPAEQKYPLLLHQRVSAFLAVELFHISDSIQLDAIGCHTTLKDAPREYDMALFIADKLSWPDTPFHASVSETLKESLPDACAVYMDYMNRHGKILSPHRHWTDAWKWFESKKEKGEKLWK